MTAASLEVQALSAGYGNTRVLDNISFRVGAGQTVAVLGRNGVGKTTLLASLMGLTKHHSGAILLGEDTISALPPATRALRGLGYVPQTRDIFASLSVAENLQVGLKQRSPVGNFGGIRAFSAPL